MHHNGEMLHHISEWMHLSCTVLVHRVCWVWCGVRYMLICNRSYVIARYGQKQPLLNQRFWFIHCFLISHILCCKWLISLGKYILCVFACIRFFQTQYHACIICSLWQIFVQNSYPCVGHGRVPRNCTC